ncbi:unnamed protein product [Mycena citricolor]|uniref:Uncharacterized protein n=1 Tax=Mycena citricolor TaxID=2018698 RepID=A0AAD2HPF2_9AGAR|nr:unnamed protein product [Mycena citricolor]
MSKSSSPVVSSEDAQTALRVLQHIKLHGLGGLPMETGTQIRILAKDIGAGRYMKPKMRGLTMFGRCYICRRQRDFQISSDSPSLCEPCRTFNAARRSDLAAPTLFSTRTALVTGGRINLGYSVAVALLRGGAETVMVTTRFPEDALRRYSLESDFGVWSSRLKIIQADFTSPRSIQAMLEAVRVISSRRLDILINNAAQTVPIPEKEQALLKGGEGSLVAVDSHSLSVIDKSLITAPARNSWEARYNEFTYGELLDVLAVNAVSPFILMRELIQDMLHDEPTHVINVSSREGMFEKEWNRRSATHVHTNMAKAALNMCTQTMAEEFKTQNIYINAVDPGYLSHQHSINHVGKSGLPERDVPLAWEDGAARVLNPILRTPLITGAFFKDYEERDWVNGWL